LMVHFSMALAYHCGFQPGYKSHDLFNSSALKGEKFI
jgi:hypothetical protein